MTLSERVLPRLPDVTAGAAALWAYRCDLERYYDLHGGDEDDIEPFRRRLLVGAVTIGVKALGLWRRGRRNALSPRYRELTLACPGLPEDLAGVRVLHVSDLHLREKDRSFTEAVAQVLRGVRVDICFLTGDFAYGHFGQAGHLKADLRAILAGIEAPLGFYGVLGNHDKSTFVPLLESLGVRMLINEGTLLRIRNTAVWLGGVDDPHFFRCAAVSDALGGASEGAYRILLAHTSESAHAAERAGAQLYLCGHTHGGQLCLPLVGAVKTHTRSSRKYLAGCWRLHEMTGYTTTGVGVSDVPVRFNAPGEVVCFTLMPT